MYGKAKDKERRQYDLISQKSSEQYGGVDAREAANMAVNDITAPLSQSLAINQDILNTKKDNLSLNELYLQASMQKQEEALNPNRFNISPTMSLASRYKEAFNLEEQVKRQNKESELAYKLRKFEEARELNQLKSSIDLNELKVQRLGLDSLQLQQDENIKQLEMHKQELENKAVRDISSDRVDSAMQDVSSQFTPNLLDKDVDYSRWGGFKSGAASTIGGLSGFLASATELGSNAVGAVARRLFAEDSWEDSWNSAKEAESTWATKALQGISNASYQAEKDINYRAPLTLDDFSRIRKNSGLLSYDMGKAVFNTTLDTGAHSINELLVAGPIGLTTKLGLSALGLASGLKADQMARERLEDRGGNREKVMNIGEDVTPMDYVFGAGYMGLNKAELSALLKAAKGPLNPLDKAANAVGKGANALGMKKVPKAIKGLAKGGAKLGARAGLGAGTEFGAEYLQTQLELARSKPSMSAYDRHKQSLEAAQMGAIAGGTIGGATSLTAAVGQGLGKINDTEKVKETFSKLKDRWNRHTSKEASASEITEDTIKQTSEILEQFNEGKIELNEETALQLDEAISTILNAPESAKVSKAQKVRLMGGIKKLTQYVVDEKANNLDFVENLKITDKAVIITSLLNEEFIKDVLTSDSKLNSPDGNKEAMVQAETIQNRTKKIHDMVDAVLNSEGVEYLFEKENITFLHKIIDEVSAKEQLGNPKDGVFKVFENIFKHGFKDKFGNVKKSIIDYSMQSLKKNVSVEKLEELYSEAKWFHTSHNNKSKLLKFIQKDREQFYKKYEGVRGNTRRYYTISKQAENNEAVEVISEEEFKKLPEKEKDMLHYFNVNSSYKTRAQDDSFVASLQDTVDKEAATVKNLLTDIIESRLNKVKGSSASEPKTKTPVKEEKEVTKAKPSEETEPQQKENPSKQKDFAALKKEDYEFYSDSTGGADTYWKRALGKIKVKIKSYTIKDFNELSPKWREKIDKKYLEVASYLGVTPFSIGTYKGDLGRRNIMQVEKASAIFAIGSIKNNVIEEESKYIITAGILRGIPVYVFDQTANKWMLWDFSKSAFIQVPAPDRLGKRSVVIGSKELFIQGKKAIDDIIDRTFSAVEESIERPSWNADEDSKKSSISRKDQSKGESTTKESVSKLKDKQIREEVRQTAQGVFLIDEAMSEDTFKANPDFKEVPLLDKFFEYGDIKSEFAQKPRMEEKDSAYQVVKSFFRNPKDPKQFERFMDKISQNLAPLSKVDGKMLPIKYRKDIFSSGTRELHNTMAPLLHQINSKASIAFRGLEWVMDSSIGIALTKQEIREELQKTFGVEKSGIVKRLSKETLNVLNRSEYESSVLEDLGNKIIADIGLKFKNTVDEEKASLLAQEVGLYSVEALINTNIITRKSIPLDAILTPKAIGKRSPKTQIRVLKFNPKVENLHEIVGYETRADMFKSLNDIAQRLKAEYTDISSYQTSPTKELKSNSVYVKNRGIIQVPDEIKNVLNKIKKTPYKISTHSIKSLKKLYNDPKFINSLKTHLGYKDISDEKYLKSSLETMKGKNLTINRSVDSFIDFINSEDALNPIYFDAFVSNSGRYYFKSSTINPEVDKLHRFLVLPEGSFQNYAIAKDGKIEDKKVYQAIAQAYGYGTDKMTTQSAIEVGEKLVQKYKEELSKDSLEEVYKNIIADPKDITIELDSGESVSLEIENPSHTYTALDTINQYTNALSSKQSSFYAAIPAESDGINNGVLLKNLQYISSKEHIRNAKSAGVVFGEEQVKSINDKYGENLEDDLYKKFGRALKKKLDESTKDADYAKNKAVSVAKSILKIKDTSKLSTFQREHINSISKAVKDSVNAVNTFIADKTALTQDGKVTSSLRKLVKPISQVFNYGAGEEASIKNFVKSITGEAPQEVYEWVSNGKKSSNKNAKALYDIYMSILKSSAKFKQSNKKLSVKELDRALLEVLNKDEDGIHAYPITIGSSSDAKYNVTTTVGEVFENSLKDTLQTEMFEALDEIYPNIKLINNFFNTILRKSATLYNNVYQSERSAYIKEKKEFTLNDRKELLDKIKPYTPYINYTSATSEDIKSGNSKLLFYKKDRAVGDLTVKVGLQKDQGHLKEHKISAKKMSFTDTGAAPGVSATHQQDGSDIGKTLLNSSKVFLPIHDAILATAKDIEGVSKEYNEVAYNNAMNYSVLEELKNVAQRTYDSAKELNNVPLEGLREDLLVTEYISNVAKFNKGILGFLAVSYNNNQNGFDSAYGKEGIKGEQAKKLLEYIVESSLDIINALNSSKKDSLLETLLFDANKELLERARALYNDEFEVNGKKIKHLDPLGIKGFLASESGASFKELDSETAADKKSSPKSPSVAEAFRMVADIIEENTQPTLEKTTAKEVEESKSTDSFDELFSLYNKAVDRGLIETSLDADLKKYLKDSAIDIDGLTKVLNFLEEGSSDLEGVLKDSNLGIPEVLKKVMENSKENKYSKDAIREAFNKILFENSAIQHSPDTESNTEETLSSKTLAEKFDDNPETAYEIQDQMKELDRQDRVVDEAHSKHLKGVLKALVSDVKDSVGGIKIVLEETASSKHQGYFDTQIKLLKVMSGKNVKQAYMSREETYVHEMVHAATAFALKALGMQSPHVRKLMAIHKEALKHLKVEDFLPEISTGNVEEDMKLAQNYYDHFKENREKGLLEFSAMGLTNKAMIAKLKSIQIVKPNIKINLDENVLQSLFNAIKSLIKAALELATNSASRSKNLYDALLKVNMDFARANQNAEALTNKNKSVIMAALGGAITKLNDGAVKALDALAKAYGSEESILRSSLAETSNVFSALKKAAVVQTKVFFNEHASAAQIEFLDKLGLRHDGVVQSIIDDFSKPDGLKRAVQKIAQLSSRIDGHKLLKKDAVSEELASMFKEPLTKGERKLFGVGILDTDLESLIDRYGLDGIKKFLDDKNRGEEEIGVLSKELYELVSKESALANNPNFTVDEYMNYIKHQTDGLAKYMSTHKAANEGQLLNAGNIATMAGSGYAVGGMASIDNKIVQIIDEMATIKSLQYLTSTTKELISKKIEAEPEAMTGLFTYIKNYKTSSDILLFKDNDFNKIKGYRSEILDPNISFKIAPISDKAKLESEGYVQVGDILAKAAGDTFSKDRVLFINTWFNIQPSWNSTATRVTAMESKGTTFTDIYNNEFVSGKEVDQTEYLNSLEAVKKYHKTAIVRMFKDKKMPKQEGKVILVPIVNTSGEFSEFRYVMDKNTKIHQLEMDTDIFDSLGTMEGLKYDKVETLKHNKDVTELIYKDWEENFNKKGQIHQYIELSLDSKDSKIREIYKILPEAMTRDLHTLFNEEPIMVRKDMLQRYFGFRDMSIKDSEIYSRSNNKALKKMLTFADALTTKIAQSAKFKIVMKTPNVIIGNIISNLISCMMQGCSFRSAMKDQMEAVEELIRYRNEIAELEKLKIRKENGFKADETKLKNLERSLKSSPLKDLMSEGLFTSIMEDVQLDANKDKFDKAIDYIYDRVPRPVQLGYDIAFISDKTSVFRALVTTVQYSDFVARYSLYKQLMKDGVPYEEVMNRVRDSFIDYDLPTSQLIKLLNDKGVLIFTKYFTRLQRVIKDDLIRKNPVRTALVIIGQQISGIDVEDPLDGSIIDKHYSAMVGGPVNLLKELAQPAILDYIPNIGK